MRPVGPETSTDAPPGADPVISTDAAFVIVVCGFKQELEGRWGTRSFAASGNRATGLGPETLGTIVVPALSVTEPSSVEPEAASFF